MESFETYRPMLFGLAYRMLGSAMEAEDVLQEAYLRSRATPDDEVQSPKAYLCKIVTRLCLDQLKSARVQREEYVGTWLPEPILTGEVDARRELDIDSLSMAFLVLMESLSPAERAVFLLHEVFDYEYSEISSIVGKEEATCRQLLHRAKKHVEEHRPRFKSTPEAQQALLSKFLAAVSAGDLLGLTSILAEDVVSDVDGGGKEGAAIWRIFGRDKVARGILGVMKRSPADLTAEIAIVNGEPGIIARTSGQVLAVILLGADNEFIRQIRIIANPAKLNLLHLAI